MELKNEIRVDEFSDEFLKKLVQVKLSKVQYDEPEPAFHIAYFSSYLKNFLGCKTVVTETHYIDRDYIEDFSSYYSKSLHPYRNYCERLHFFNIELTRDNLIQVLKEIKGGKENGELFQKLEGAYLGFLVVRPIPAAFAGRVVLVPPRETRTPELTRNFPCVREYKVNLAGIELKLRGLGFQQQDQATCECATAAIWVALQKVAYDYHRRLLAPSEIKRNATRYRLDWGGGLGLSHQQICEAIRACDLTPEFQVVKGRPAFCKSLIYTYVNSGIPVIANLGLKRRNVCDENRVRYFGAHSVTVVGFAIDKDKDAKYQLDERGTSIKDPGQRIVKIYAHDDSIGPYSSLSFVEGPWSTLKMERIYNNRIYYADIISLVIPLYPKIRLTQEALQSRAILYLKALEKTTKEDPSSGFSLEDVEVDIIICRGNAYREELLENLWIPENELFNLLEKLVLSRYVGIARVFWGGRHIFDLVLDTTDSPLGDFALALVVRDKNLKDEAEDLSEVLGIKVFPSSQHLD